LAKKTLRDGVLAGIGGFGALFEVPQTLQRAGVGEWYRWCWHQTEAGV
jgi:phosphoribosylaminoimidazole (AIR) synthetase